VPGLPSWVAPYKQGAAIEVFLQPRAAKNMLVGLHGTALKVKVTSPPVDGRANEAASHFLAKLLDLPRSEVTVLAGETSRHKRFWVRSMTPRRVASVLGGVLSSRAHEPG
jgi:hypothetical protein